jgi:hypothetical protein
MNVAFSIINGVNLLFGGYFLYNAVNVGHIISQAQLNAAPRIYGLTYLFSTIVAPNPLPFITVGLGVIPLVFSALFWLIPILRQGAVKKNNDGIKLQNFRKLGYGRIWNGPQSVKPAELDTTVPECRPRNIDAARDRVIKEMGSYSVPEVTMEEAGEAYSFPELVREKEALAAYRDGINPDASDLGKTVFDSGD